MLPNPTIYTLGRGAGLRQHGRRAPVEVVRVNRYSENTGDSVYAAVLTVPQIADAYELEVGGTVHTVIAPARRAQ